MRAIAIGIMLVGAAVVVAGVVIEGTAENPAALVLPFLFSTSILEVARKRNDLWVRLGVLPMVLGASAAGVAWTLGPDHASSPVAGLVWVGITIAIAGSAQAAGARPRG